VLTYNLPSELIAQEPCQPRDAARLLVLDRATDAVSHRVFRDLPELLQPGDCLVLNDTRVVHARLFGTRADTDGKVELLLLQPEGDSTYRCLGQPGKRLKEGAKLLFNHGSVQAEVVSAVGGTRLVRFEGQPIDEVLGQLGNVPLPPYIRRPADHRDADWYQTVYARSPGAVAAPTAGLHFTESLLDELRRGGVQITFVTLHVGWGTFKPVGEKEMKSGWLHAERFQMPAETAETIRQTKAAGGRVIAVGTTVVRVLETFALRQAQDERAEEGTTDLFIRPPFQFQVVDGMITNFHLQGTSLLYLVAAFAGEEKVLSAYQEAIRRQYRFYSYGDAMLLA